MTYEQEAAYSTVATKKSGIKVLLVVYNEPTLANRWLHEVRYY